MRKYVKALVLSTILAAIGAALLFFFLSSGSGPRRGTGPRPKAEDVAAAVPDPSEPAPADATSLEKSQASESAGDLAAAGLFLQGKVSDEHGRGIAGATVFVVHGGEMRGGFGRGGRDLTAIRDRFLGKVAPRARDALASEAITDSEGRYSIPLSSIPPDEYTVLARHVQYAPQAKDWTREAEVAESVELDFLLGLGVTIRGFVFDRDEAPVAGALVQARADGGGRGFEERFGGGGRLVDRDVTKEDGAFTLVVDDGTYSLAASAAGFKNGSARNVVAGAEDIIIALEPAASLAVKVIDLDGEAVASAKLTLYPGFGGGPGGGGPGGGGPGGGGFGRRGGDDGERGGGPPERMMRVFSAPLAMGTTNEQGVFRFEALPFTSYALYAERSAYVGAWKRGELRENEKESSVEVALEPASLLNGVVMDSEKNAVAGALVLVADARVTEAENEWRQRIREEGGRGERGRDGGGERNGRGGRDGPAPGGEAARLEAPAEPARPEALNIRQVVSGVETDGEGRFTVDTLAKGRYSLSVQSDAHLTYRQDAIELDGKVELEIALEDGLQLDGEVVSSVDQKPVPGASVYVRLGDSERRQAKADADGRFAIGGLFLGAIDEVQLNARGFSATLIEDLEIQANPSPQKVKFEMSPSASIAGVVTDQAGAPVANARIRVRPAPQVVEAPAGEEGQRGGRGRDRDEGERRNMRRSFMLAAEGRSDATGSFRIEGVDASGPVVASVEHSSFKSFESEPIAVEPGKKVEDLRFTLSSGARLAVLVLGPDGTPVSEARLQLTKVATGEELGQEEDRFGGFGEFGGRGGRGGRGGGRGGGGARIMRSSGPDGKAVFAGIDAGDYTLFSSRRGFQPHTTAAALVNDRETTLSVELLPENVVTGIVRDTLGQPVAGAEVTVSRRVEGSPGEESRATAAADGTFRVGSLGLGAYSLRAQRQGFAERRIEAVEVNSSVEVVLERLGAIAGRVVGAQSGAPVTRFQLRLRSEADARQEGRETRRGFGGGPGGGGPGGGFANAGLGGGGVAGGGFGGGPGGFGGRGGWDRKRVEDPNGLFVMENIPPASYLLEVTAEGFPGRQVRVQVPEGGLVENIEVLLQEGLAVSGLVVRRGTPEPIPDAQVLMVPMVSRQGGDGAAIAGAESRRSGERATQERRIIGAERRSGQGELRTVADPESEEARQARALLRSAQSAGASQIRTDESGFFQVTGVEPGLYQVIVHHRDFVPGRQQVEIGVDRVAQDLRFDLDVGEELHGNVLSEDGSRAAGVMVTLRDAEGLIKSTQTDAAGEYRFTGLVEGNYSIFARASQGTRPRMETVAIEKGSNRWDYRLGEAAEGGNRRTGATGASSGTSTGTPAGISR
jgi:protocatechuate 3,4-dioxygenase beta subunit